MTTFRFWRRWLLGLSLGIAVFGIVLAVFPQSHLMHWSIHSHVDPVFWHTTPMPEAATEFQAWIYGVMGATVAGWGVMLTFLVQIPFERREPWAWNCVAGSFALWFPIDTLSSAYYGVFFNVAFNTVLLSLVALPLAFTRREFSSREGAWAGSGL